MRILPIVLIVLVVIGLESSVVGSLLDTATRTISPGTADLVILSVQDPNPLRSNLPVSLEDVISELPGVREVSPEVLVFTSIGGKDVVVRGVEPIHLIRGDRLKIPIPEGENWILAGRSAAKSLRVKVGDVLLIPASFRKGFWVGTIEGVFETGTSMDSELIVPLSAAQWMAMLPGTSVTLFRVWGEVSWMMEGSGPLLLPLRFPKKLEAVIGETVSMPLELASLSRSRHDYSVEVLQSGKVLWEKRLSLGPGEIWNGTAEVEFEGLGSVSLFVDPPGVSFPINATFYLGRLSLRAPSEAVLNRSFEVEVLADGSPVGGAIVQTPNGEFTTNSSGRAKIFLGLKGAVTISARKGGYKEATAVIRVKDIAGSIELGKIGFSGNATLVGEKLFVKKGEIIDFGGSAGKIMIDGSFAGRRILNTSTLSPGEHDIKVVVLRDGLKYVAVGTLMVDSSPPRIVVFPVSGSPVKEGEGRISIMDDTVIGSVRIRGRAQYYVMSHSFNLTLGPGRWDIIATDVTGRTSELNVTFKEAVWEANPPRIGVSLGNGLNITVSDDQRVDMVALSIRSGSYQGSWSWEPGSPTFSAYIPKERLPPSGSAEVVAVDLWGNVATFSFSAAFGGPEEPDNEPPEVRLLSGTEVSEPKVKLYVWDESGIGNLTVLLDGNEYNVSKMEGEIEILLPGPGRHNISVRAEDVYGNFREISFEVDYVTYGDPWMVSVFAPLKSVFLDRENVKLRLALRSFVSGRANFTIRLDDRAIKYQVNLTEGWDYFVFDVGRLGAGYHIARLGGQSASFYVIPARSEVLDLAGAYGRIRFSSSDKGLLTYAVRTTTLSGLVMMGTMFAISLLSGLTAISSSTRQASEPLRGRAWLLHALGARRSEAWRIAAKPLFGSLLSTVSISAGLVAAFSYLLLSRLTFFGYPISMVGIPVGVLVALLLPVHSALRLRRPPG